MYEKQSGFVARQCADDSCTSLGFLWPEIAGGANPGAHAVSSAITGAITHASAGAKSDPGASSIGGKTEIWRHNQHYSEQ